MRLKSEVYEHQDITIHFSLSLPLVLPPGFQEYFLSSWNFDHKKPLEFGAPLVPGRNEVTLTVSAGRGVYKGRCATLFVRDFLGLTQGKVELPGDETVVIWPLAGEIPLLEPQPSGEGEVVPTRKRQRSDELLEVRKYYPGDDYRRINWKVYAHMDELFIRIGEENPPPEARFSLIFDPSRPPSMPLHLAADFLDRRISTFLALIEELDRRGHPLRIYLPGQSHPFDGASGNKPQLLTALAALSPTEDSVWVWNEGDETGKPLIFTVPRSPAIDALTESLHRRGLSFALDLAPWPFEWKEPPAPQRRPWWVIPDRLAHRNLLVWKEAHHLYEKDWFAGQGGLHE